MRESTDDRRRSWYALTLLVLVLVLLYLATPAARVSYLVHIAREQAARALGCMEHPPGHGHDPRPPTTLQFWLKRQREVLRQRGCDALSTWETSLRNGQTQRVAIS